MPHQAAQQVECPECPVPSHLQPPLLLPLSSAPCQPSRNLVHRVRMGAGHHFAAAVVRAGGRVFIIHGGGAVQVRALQMHVRQPCATACNCSATTAVHSSALLFFPIQLHMCRCPLEYEPAGWHVPALLMPWLPSVAINLVVFRQAPCSEKSLACFVLFRCGMVAHAVTRLIVIPLKRGSQIWPSWPPNIPTRLRPAKPATAPSHRPCSVGALPTEDYREVGIYFGAAVLFYLLVSLPMTYIKQSAFDWVNAEELRWVLQVLTTPLVGCECPGLTGVDRQRWVLSDCAALDADIAEEPSGCCKLKWVLAVVRRFSFRLRPAVQAAGPAAIEQ